tara:strand:+ start:2908 stop:3606 length:699 start_codon:yes stop_codon:yes gene_type:complete
MFSRSSINYLVAAATFALMSVTCNAQLVVYNFGSSSSGSTAPSSIASNLSGGDFSIGGDISFTLGTTSPASSNVNGGSGSGTFRTKGDGYKPAEFAPGYMTVTLTPNSGFILAVTSVTFNSYSTLTGPSNWALQYSIDGGSFTSLATGTNNGSSWASQTSGTVSLTGIASHITFRLFGTGASSSSGAFNIDDFTVSGSTSALSAVPEPASFGILAGLCVIGVASTRRRLRNA